MCARHRWTSSRSSLRRAWRSRRRRSALPAEVEELVTVPSSRTSPASRRTWTSCSTSVEQLSSITPSNGRLAASEAARPGTARHGGAHPAELGRPALHDSASSTSRTMKIGLSSERYSLIELSSLVRHKIRRACCASRCGERRCLGKPQRPASCAPRSTAHGRPRRVRRPGPARHGGRSRCAAAQALAGLDRGHPAASSTRRTSGSPSGTSCPWWAPRALPRSGSPRRMDGACVSTTSPTSRQAIHRRRRRRRQRRPRPAAHRREVPVGEHARGHAGVEEALDALRPGLTGIEIDSRIFRPATFIETAISNLTRALLIGCLLLVVVLIAFLFEWRTALISLVSILLSLMAAGSSSRFAVRRSTRWCLPV